MDDPRFQLVIQLPGDTPQDFDRLLELEDSLAESFDGTPHEIDGHDFGSGTGNIFVDTNEPIGAFELAKPVLDPTKYPTMKVAYRAFDEDDYVLIWPENSAEPFELM